MRRLFGLGLVVVLAGIAGCGNRGGRPVAAPAPNDTANETALRVKALAALDAGDLDAADSPLRSIVRQRPDAVGSRGLLDAVAAITGRDAIQSYMLVQQPLTKVDAPPPAVSTNAKPQKVAVETTKSERRYNGEQGIGDLQRYQAPSDSQRDPYIRVPAMIPRTDAGLRLVMTRFSGGRWIALYGHDDADIRIAAIIGGDGKLEAHLDFVGWRQNGQESGIGHAELYGDMLYVEDRERSIVAIEIKTGKVRFKTEPVYGSDSLFAGETQIAMWSYDGLVLFDRKTGTVTGRAETKGVTKVDAKDGVLEAIVYPSDVVRVKMDIKTPAPLKLSELPEGTSKIASDKLEANDEAQRAKAYESLETGATVDAVALLRPILDRHPQNFATAALLRAARSDLAEARDKAREVIEKQSPILVNGDKLAGRTSTMATPRVKMREEPDPRTLDPLASAMLTTDLSPSDRPIAVAPGWLPDRIKERSRGVTTTNGTHVAAVYGPDVVATFESGRLVSLLRFDATGDVRFVNSAEWAGGDVVALLQAKERQIVGVDPKSGAMSWRTAIDAMSFTVSRGVVFCSSKSSVAVLDAQSGKFLSETAVSRGFQLFGAGPSVPTVTGWSPGTRLVIDLS